MRGLISTCTVYQKSTTYDDQNAPVEAYTTARYTDMPCRFRWLSGNERVVFDANTWMRDGRMYCSTDYDDISVEDRVYYGGNYYHIVNINHVEGRGAHLKIDIKLVVD